MTEYLSIALFSITAMVLYSVYRYFCEEICQLDDDLVRVNLDTSKEINALNIFIQGMQQQFKDAIQSNSICCKSSIAKLNNRIDELTPKKDKYEPKKPAAKKSTPTH